MFKRGLLIVVFLVLISSVSATDYYVDNAASGSNSGTSWIDAWESFGDIQWNSVQPGDTVYISGGSSSMTYHETLNIGASGTAGNPIYIRVGQSSPHDGLVILDGGNTDIYGININGMSYISVSGQLGSSNVPNMLLRNHGNNEVQLTDIEGIDIGYLEIGPHTTSLGASKDDAVDVDGYLGGGNRIHHNKIHDFYDYGIVILPPCSPAGCGASQIFKDDYLRIDHNEIYNMGHDGIHAGRDAGGITIDHNEIHDQPAGYSETNCPTGDHGYSGIYADGMHLRGFNYLTVAYNKIYDIDNDCEGMWSFIYLECDSIQSNVAANDIYVYNNVMTESLQQSGPYPNSGGIVFACKYCGSLTRAQIVSNTIVDMRNGAISFGSYEADPVSDCVVANNIIYNANTRNIGGDRMVMGLQGHSITGITTGSFGDSPIPDIIWDYNLIDIANNDPILGNFRGTRYSYSEWLSNSGADAHSVVDDPTFVSWSQYNAANLHLDSDDVTAKDTGISLTLFNDDYDGNSRPQGSSWDMGAYEYISGQQQCHDADNDCDDCIGISELIDYISEWKIGDVTISELMEAIGLWKSGC